MKRNGFHYVALLFASLFVTPSLFAEEQSVSMETSKANGQELLFVVNGNSDIKVDWGDGVYVSYSTDSIKGVVKGPKITILGNENWTALSAEGNGLVSLNVSKAVNLKTLYCGYNELSALNLTANVALTDVACSNNKLTSLSTSKNTNLIYLNCANNQLSSLSSIFYDKQIETVICSGNNLATLPAGITSVKSLWCADNGISSLNVSRLEQLNSLVCSGNGMNSLSMGKKDSMLVLWMNDNNVKELDLSNAPLLKVLNCASNELTMITFNNPTTKKDYSFIDCSNNHLLYSSMISRTKVSNYATNYIYYPQSIHEIQASVDIADTLDLSDTRFNAEAKAVASYKMYDNNGNVLQSGVDYRLINGQKVRFYKAYTDSVSIEISSSRFYPDLTIKTTKIQVTDRVPIKNVLSEESDGLTVLVQDGCVELSAEKEIAVRIYSIEGVLYWKETINKGKTRVALPHGVYVVNSHKVKI